MSTRLELSPERAQALAERHGTPFYVYDLDVLRARVGRARALNATLLYAVKANPNLEVLRALESEGQSELALVDAALQRLDKGEHSRCSTCGGEIASARLSALPWTDTCIACAR